MNFRRSLPVLDLQETGMSDHTRKVMSGLVVPAMYTFLAKTRGKELDRRIAEPVD